MTSLDEYMDNHGDMYISYVKDGITERIKVFSTLLKKSDWFKTLITWELNNQSLPSVSIPYTIDITETCSNINIYPNLHILRTILVHIYHGSKYIVDNKYLSCYYETKYNMNCFDSIIFMIYINELDIGILMDLDMSESVLKSMDINEYREMLRKLSLIDNRFEDGHMVICGRILKYKDSVPHMSKILVDNRYEFIIGNREIDDEYLYKDIFGEDVHRCIYESYTHPDVHLRTCGRYTSLKHESSYNEGYYCSIHIIDAIEDHTRNTIQCEYKHNYTRCKNEATLVGTDDKFYCKTHIDLLFPNYDEDIKKPDISCKPAFVRMIKEGSNNEDFESSLDF